MGCLLDDLRAFGTNADHWTTIAQDEGEWRKTAEQGVKNVSWEIRSLQKKLWLTYDMQ